jgi:hypothetical protein
VKEEGLAWLAVGRQFLNVKGHYNVDSFACREQGESKRRWVRGKAQDRAASATAKESSSSK